MRVVQIEPGPCPILIVSEIADGKVVVDGNHPWAGERVIFNATVTSEIGRAHV